MAEARPDGFAIEWDVAFLKKASGSQAFPVRLFALYVLFYSGQAVYSTYFNLYFSSVGLTESQIGMIVSVSTACLLAAQPLWGMASDRAFSKNRVLLFLYAAAALASLCFYFGRSYWFLLVMGAVFAVCFSPLVPLQDNFVLEQLERSRWEYGQVRMGGTIGYCLTVLCIGFFLRDGYRPIFWMVAGCMAGCLFLCAGLPKVRGYGAPGEKKPWRELLCNHTLIGLILFNLVFSVGVNFYHNFYPIYYVSDAVGGGSAQVGMMMFLGAASEIPMLLLIHRMIRRMGIRGTLILAGCVTMLRWLLLAVLHGPIPILLVSLLHGIGYTSFSCCLVTYIGKTVPPALRATGQSLNALLGNAVSKVLFGFLGGLASQRLGADRIMLYSAAMMAAGTLAFAVWSRNRADVCKPGPGGETPV